jgi:hypothetical protein
MTDQLDTRIRAFVLEVVDSAPVPPTFEDIESGFGRATTVGADRRFPRRGSVAIIAAVALTVAGVVVLAGAFRDTTLPQVATPAAAPTKPPEAKDACALVTEAERSAAAQGRTTPRVGLIGPNDNTSTSYCEFGAFEVPGADGSTDFWVTLNETVGTAAGADYKNARRLLIRETSLSGLPTGFVGVTGSPKKGSDTLAPVNYVAYSKTSKKLLIVGAFATSSTRPCYKNGIPVSVADRCALTGLNHSVEAHDMINRFLMLALSRI